MCIKLYSTQPSGARAQADFPTGKASKGLCRAVRVCAMAVMFQWVGRNCPLRGVTNPRRACAAMVTVCESVRGAHLLLAQLSDKLDIPTDSVSRSLQIIHVNNALKIVIRFYQTSERKSEVYKKNVTTPDARDRILDSIYVSVGLVPDRN